MSRFEESGSSSTTRKPSVSQNVVIPSCLPQTWCQYENKALLLYNGVYRDVSATLFPFLFDSYQKQQKVHLIRCAFSSQTLQCSKNTVFICTDCINLFLQSEPGLLASIAFGSCSHCQQSPTHSISHGGATVLDVMYFPVIRLPLLHCVYASKSMQAAHKNPQSQFLSLNWISVTAGRKSKKNLLEH